MNVAVIPAKAHSSRVPEKNFRSFFQEHSLLEIKIRQCVSSGAFDAVFVSSDSMEAERIAKRNGAEFLLRSEELCRDETPWSKVLVGILEQLPCDNNTGIGWCPPTSPLFHRYDDVLRDMGERYDSAMTVTQHKHYFLNHDFLPINFQFGVWASYSQLLRPLFQMNCAFWFATKEKMIRNRFQTGDNPFFYETSQVEGIDIDTMEEFELASVLYQRMIQKSKDHMK